MKRSLENLIGSIKDTASRTMISWHYRRYFINIRKTLSLGRKIFTHEKVAWSENNDFSKLVIIFLAKNTKSLKAIRYLCRKGYGQDASIVARMLFENLVDLHYISRDTVSRSRDYIDYGHYEQLRFGAILLREERSADEINKIRKADTEIQKKWDLVKSRFSYSGHNGKIKIHSRWTCKSLRDVAREVGLENAYDYFFVYSSQYTHATPLSATSYVVGKTNDQISLGIGSSHYLIPELLATATAFYLDMLAIVNNEYHMGFDKTLEKLQGMIPRATDKESTS